MTAVLALDLATTTGWAHSDGTSGIAEHKIRTGDSPGVRFLLFRGWLSGFLEDHPTDLIAYEQAAGMFRSLSATHVVHGFIAHTEAVAAEYGVEITSRPSSTVKKWMMGDVPPAKRSKARMIQVVENLWGIEMATHDQADAVALLWGIMNEMGVDGTPWHTPRAVHEYRIEPGQVKGKGRRTRGRPKSL